MTGSVGCFRAARLDELFLRRSNNQMIEVGASFRDPRARVVEHEGKIFREIYDRGVSDYLEVLRSSFYSQAEKNRWLVAGVQVAKDERSLFSESAQIILQHEKVPFVSYPYEWSFSQLRDAALFHLDIHLNALEFGVSMLDSSAFNVQFIGATPIFIDYCSFGPWREGDIWFGHHQFCEQFLNPLLLYSKMGVKFQDWYRGGGGGVSTRDLYRILPFWKMLSPSIFFHVFAKNFLDHYAEKKWPHPGGISQSRKVVAQKRGLPKKSFSAILRDLQGHLSSLRAPKEEGVWKEYSGKTTYSELDRARKSSFVNKVCETWKPAKLLDLGGNTGVFSEIALASGVETVILIDSDHGATSVAHERAVSKGLNLLSLTSNLMDLSPARGWRESERQSLRQRIDDWQPDMICALALIHHLVIGNNAPLAQVVDWLTSFAPKGIIEFVPKSDPTVQFMLRYRKDIFDEYRLDRFQELLARQNQIVREDLADGRVLFAYRKT